MNNVDDIIKNILLCHLSYSEPEQLKNVLHFENIDYKPVYNIIKNSIYITNIDSDVNLYIFKDKNILYIVFRGTSSFKDVLIDLNIKFIKILNPYVKVHSGFYNQYFSIYEKIYEYITDDITVINVLGHSLGGGVATITSALIANYCIINKNKKQVNCYVFGCPRVGDKKFRKFFIESVDNHYNICFYNDFIGMIPVNYKYYHICNLYKIKKNKDISLCKEDIWYKRFGYILRNVNCISSINNHKLISYLHYFLTIKNI